MEWLVVVVSYERLFCRGDNSFRHMEYSRVIEKSESFLFFNECALFTKKTGRENDRQKSFHL